MSTAASEESQQRSRGTVQPPGVPPMQAAESQPGWLGVLGLTRLDLVATSQSPPADLNDGAGALRLDASGNAVLADGASRELRREKVLESAPLASVTSAFVEASFRRVFSIFLHLSASESACESVSESVPL